GAGAGRRRDRGGEGRVPGGPREGGGALLQVDAAQDPQGGRGHPAEPEEEDRRTQAAQHARHQSTAVTRTPSGRRRTTTRARRRGSYPFHLLAGTSLATTCSKPRRSKNCCARLSTVQAKTESRPRRP